MKQLIAAGRLQWEGEKSDMFKLLENLVWAQRAMAQAAEKRIAADFEKALKKIDNPNEQNNKK